MALAPAITDLEQLKSHPAVAWLLAWNPAAVTGAKFDRDEMTITVDRSCIREACALLRDDASAPSIIFPTSLAWIGIRQSLVLK